MKERNSSTLGEKKIGPSPREKQNKTEKTTKKKKSLLGIAVGGEETWMVAERDFAHVDI